MSEKQLSLEQRFNQFEAQFYRMFPKEIISKIEQEAKDFYEKINQKPKTIVSGKIMSRVLKMHPEMKANQIDDFLLKNGIGSEKALIDYLDLEEKNRKNQPVSTGDETE